MAIGGTKVYPVQCWALTPDTPIKKPTLGLSVQSLYCNPYCSHDLLLSYNLAIRDSVSQCETVFSAGFPKLDYVQVAIVIMAQAMIRTLTSV